MLMQLRVRSGEDALWVNPDAIDSMYQAKRQSRDGVDFTATILELRSGEQVSCAMGPDALIEQIRERKEHAAVESAVRQSRAVAGLG